MFLLNKEEYLRHIDKADYIEEMRRILDIVEISLRDYSIESSDFLDPYTRKLSISILNRFDNIAYFELGGREEYERKVIMIYPDYHYLLKDEYSIAALRLLGDLDGLSHPDFLGSILALGIKRDKIGDIIIGPDHADLVVKKEIKDFIIINFKKVGNKNFKVKEIDLAELIFIEDEYEEVFRTLSSNRLDAYISSAYNISRKTSTQLIEKGRVKLNFEPISKASTEVNEEDLVSVRSYGRSRLKSIDGISKKKRLKVSIHILK